MSEVKVLRKGAVTIGFQCINGHNHGSMSDAANCDAEKFAEQQTEVQKAAEVSRLTQIKLSADFKNAVLAASQLGASPDDAEDVVLKNGCEKVLAAIAAVKGLGIPRPKPVPVKPAANQGQTTDSGKTT